MSRATVLAYVKTQCQSITGVNTVLVGAPSNNPPVEAILPLIILGAAQPKWAPFTLTAGGAGLKRADYTVNMIVLMGRTDMLPGLAETQRGVWSQRIHQKFANDGTLGGNVWDAEITDGVDNIDTYQRTSLLPQAAYHLQVTEMVQRNAVAD